MSRPDCDHAVPGLGRRLEREAAAVAGGDARLGALRVVPDPDEVGEDGDRAAGPGDELGEAGVAGAAPRLDLRRAERGGAGAALGADADPLVVSFAARHPDLAAGGDGEIAGGGVDLDAAARRVGAADEDVAPGGEGERAGFGGDGEVAGLRALGGEVSGLCGQRHGGVAGGGDVGADVEVAPGGGGEVAAGGDGRR